MGVYEDMANDAGYRYGTDENRQMAQSIEADHYRQYQELEQEQAKNARREILFRRFGPIAVPKTEKEKCYGRTTQFNGRKC